MFGGQIRRDRLNFGQTLGSESSSPVDKRQFILYFYIVA
jgi:hypothetical protein